MRIRFHLDENVPGAIAEALRRRGIDTTTTLDAGLVGAADERHLVFARKRGRVVVTHDADFLRLHAGGVEHAGIVFCRPGAKSLGEIVRALALLHIRNEPRAMMNTAVFL